jgi:hypothetical protein
MTLSATALSLLIYISLGMTIAAPLILVLLLARDWKAGRLW